MLTVLEALKKTEEYFTKKNIESPRLNSELLLCKVLNCQRIQLYIQYDRPLTDAETSSYRELLQRRANREPLQYILESTEFYGLKFNVNKNVLIPRQETEILVEKIVEDHKNKEELKVLDIGTGSGILAICMAKKINCIVDAVDISTDALKVAKENAVLNEVDDKINFFMLDILKEDISDKYDIIVSNPPYISLEEYKKLEPELLNYEPSFALTDEGDGYKYYKEISNKGYKSLVSNGMLYFEAGAGMSEKILEIMQNEGFSDLNVRKDYLNYDRVIYGKKP